MLRRRTRINTLQDPVYLARETREFDGEFRSTLNLGLDSNRDGGREGWKGGNRAPDTFYLTSTPNP